MRNIRYYILFFFIINSFSQTNTTDFVTIWRTDYPGVSNNRSITIPTFYGETYNYDVDWDNDGIFDEFGITGNITHDFGTSGIYKIRIKGLFPRIFFNNELDKKKILGVEQWGNQQWTSMKKAFTGCSYINEIGSDIPNLADVTDMSSMFYFAVNFNQPLNNWDVSNVTNMRAMFSYAREFNQPLNNWNVGNVTSMAGLFNSCRNFNQPLNNWNVSNVTDMQFMFQFTSNFNQSINNWDVSNVTNMRSLFNYATNFNQPLNNWNVENVTNMKSMFKNTNVFNQQLDSWSVFNVLDMNSMFKNASLFNQPLNNWDVNNVTNMEFMFFECHLFNQDLSNWNTSNVTNMFNMFNNAFEFNQDIGSWNISNLTNASGMFDGVSLALSNYDSLLINWQQQSHHNNVTFSGGNSKYCLAENARNILSTIDDWAIYDLGKENEVIPNFIQIERICYGEVLNPLPIISNNGINGSWLPAINNETTTEYEFTPNSDQCASKTTMTISVNPLVTPIFTQVSPIFYNDYLAPLPTISTNGITGTWIPEINNTATTEYTFTPTENQCATETTMIIEVLPAIECPKIIYPNNNQNDINLSSYIKWNKVKNSTSYNLRIGTYSNSADILNIETLNNLFNTNTLLEYNTTYYVTVIAYDNNGNSLNCNEIVFTTTFKIPKFFTPNGDGINDYWNINDNKNLIDYIYIFNRFGKVLAKIKPNDATQWNGKYKNSSLFDNDYWYLIQYGNGKQLKGHFTLKR